MCYSTVLRRDVMKRFIHKAGALPNLGIIREPPDTIQSVKSQEVAAVRVALWEH